MRTIATLTAAAVLAGTLGVALAQEGNPLGRHQPRPQALSTDTMRQKIDLLGYDVRSLKVDDGVFKARIVERQSGGLVKARFDLATGELVRAQLAQ
jgi:hypothetical protein